MGEKVYELVEKLYIDFSRRFDEIDARFDKVDEKLDKKADKADIVRFENDITPKLEALFDGYKAITETLTGQTARMQRIEDKLETHDIQIHVLDKTKTDKRKAK